MRHAGGGESGDLAAADKARDLPGRGREERSMTKWHAGGWLVAALTLGCGGAEGDEWLVDPVSADEDVEEDYPLEGVPDDGKDEPPRGDQSEAHKMVLVHPGTTVDAELIKTLPIGKSASGAPRRVVLRLGPKQIPDLAKGDSLLTAAEVQVTTRCDIGQIAPGCAYNPNVRAQLILTGSAGDVDPSGNGSKPLSDVKSLTCTKAEHHCMFTFRPGETRQDLVGGHDLPCVAKDDCHVNLVMWAWHSEARSGGKDHLLVGGNEGNYLANGIVEQDKARLMVVRERGITASDRKQSETSGGGDVNVPISAKETLIYSHRLKPGSGELLKNEQFLVEANIVTAVSSRARFSTHMFLTKDPKDTSPGGLEKTSPTSIGEHNGINCTSGTSPCTTRKVGVFRVTDDIQGPVYVNIIARSEVPGPGSAKVTVKRGKGHLRSTRYRANLKR
jgi:hypothetical protein